MSTESQQHPEVVAVPVRWNLATVPTLFANQFLVTLGPPTANGTPDGIYLVVASVAPPAILGDTPETRRPYVEEATRNGITAEVHGRYWVSRERLAELITLLQTSRDKYDAATLEAINAGSPPAERREEGRDDKHT